MKIAVYGSAAGDIGDGVRDTARAIGREIARRRHILVTGACTGLPYDATLAAREADGVTWGYSPGLNLEDHVKRFNFPTEGFSDLFFVPPSYPHHADKQSSMKYRNVITATNCDAGIIISGRIGTLNEFTLLYDMGKNIGVVQGTGGITDSIKTIVEAAKKPSGSEIVYEWSPVRLVERLEQLHAQPK